ncbi:uncharacterized protein [Oryza sativa Japonica Group]|uniref:Os11g0584600 protein n=1 Tax=Oryza sativa subsp. japonica TaxID=39947 RepID=A0A0P0Y3R7_ORYSJ|nr:uncharacterized protein LOC107276865 isoform X2 [Oryza sativa Japonica Group]BAT14627.1 Os11g0584600 [Oryza sativa Japonica Group]
MSNSGKEQRRMDRFIVIPFSTCRNGSSVDVVDGGGKSGKKPQGGGGEGGGAADHHRQHVAHIGWDGSTNTTTSLRSWNRAAPPSSSSSTTTASTSSALAAPVTSRRSRRRRGLSCAAHVLPSAAARANSHRPFLFRPQLPEPCLRHRAAPFSPAGRRAPLPLRRTWREDRAER